MLQFIQSHPYCLGIITVLTALLIFNHTPSEKEQLRRGNTKHLRKAAEDIKAELDKTVHEWQLESVRCMITNFEKLYSHTIQGKADLDALIVGYLATKWKLEQSRRYIDGLNEVMLHGQNLMADRNGNLWVA